MAPHKTHWPVDRRIVLPRLLDQLNAALSEEWLAYYQYWMCARMVTGDHVYELRGLLERSADQCRSNADTIAERILALGGIPPTTPSEWYRYARCTYDTPTRFDAEYLLAVTRVGEECSRRRYAELAEMTAQTDPVTNKMVNYLLETKLESVEQLTALINDAIVARQLAEPA